MGLWGVGNAGGFNSCQRSLAARLDWKLLSKRHFWGGTAGKINILSVLVPIHLFFFTLLGHMQQHVVPAALKWRCRWEGDELSPSESLQFRKSGPSLCFTTQPPMARVNISGGWLPGIMKTLKLTGLFWTKINRDFLPFFFFFYNLEQKFNFLDMEVRTE